MELLIGDFVVLLNLRFNILGVACKGDITLKVLIFASTKFREKINSRENKFSRKLVPSRYNTVEYECYWSDLSRQFHSIFF